MSGAFTRKMYDDCARDQDTKQSTDPLALVLDLNKYVNCNDTYDRSPKRHSHQVADMVDIESSLRGMDKIHSKCDEHKHPYCGPHGCLLRKRSNTAHRTNPHIYSRGKPGQRSVITTNMRMPTHPGYYLPSEDICNCDEERQPRNRTPFGRHYPTRPAPQSPASDSDDDYDHGCYGHFPASHAHRSRIPHERYQYADHGHRRHERRRSDSSDDESSFGHIRHQITAR